MSGDTQLQPIVFQPGIRKDLTEYMAEGGWVDCDKIRFRNGRAEKIGGWVRETVTQVTDAAVGAFTGVARAILAWTDLASKEYLAVASNLKVELVYGNQIYDITPVRHSSALTNEITTISTQTTVSIHDINHGLLVGDYVFVNSQATAINGITLAGQYQVFSVTDADNYVLDSGIAATGSGTGGGALAIDYLLENGPQDNGNLTGWSGGTWNTPGQSGDGYGLPRAGVGGLDLRQWSLDNWGQDLLACVRGGPIYHWDATGGPSARLVNLDSAPQTNSFILVAQPERVLVAFGSEVFATGIFDPLIIRWATQETLDDWTPTDTNTAGEYRLPKGNFIVGAVQTRGEIVIFTDTDVYSMTYIGGNDVFQISPLGSNISAVSQHSFIDVNGTVFWQGTDNFYMYNGVVTTIPCTLNKYIFDQFGDGRMNFDQQEKSFAGILNQTNEIIFLYPRYDETEVGHYIKYNYAEQVFDFGSLDRTVWLDKGVFPNPYAVDPSGILYIHEEGKDDDASPMLSYIRSAYFDIGDGQEVLFIDRILPDIMLAQDRAMDMYLYFKRYPHPAAEVITKGPYNFDDTMGQISVRGKGRQMSIEYRATATGANFEIGKVRIGVQTDGGR